MHSIKVNLFIGNGKHILLFFCVDARPYLDFKVHSQRGLDWSLSSQVSACLSIFNCQLVKSCFNFDQCVVFFFSTDYFVLCKANNIFMISLNSFFDIMKKYSMEGYDFIYCHEMVFTYWIGAFLLGLNIMRS